MKLKIKGVTLEIEAGIEIAISEDGKTITCKPLPQPAITWLPWTTPTEPIRITPGPYEPYIHWGTSTSGFQCKDQTIYVDSTVDPKTIAKAVADQIRLAAPTTTPRSA